MPKHIYFTLLFVFGIGLPASLLSQPTNEEEKSRFEKIRLARQEFITAELQLTTEESKRFFPVFWEYDAQLHRLRKQQYRSHIYRDEEGKKQTVALSESDAREVLNNRLETEAKMLELKRKSMADFMQILPATKLVLLDRAEHTFRKQLVNRMHRQQDKDCSNETSPKKSRF